MGILDSLFSGGSASASTGAPSSPVPDFLTSPATGDFLSAIGAGLLTGDRYNWIGPGFQQQLQVNAKNADARQSRGALKAALMAMGFSDAEAEKYSASKEAAELVASYKQTQANSAQTASALAGAPSLGGLFGGGSGAGVSNLGMGGARTSPTASGQSGGAQIPGSLPLDDNNIDVAVRTAMAEAGNQGPDGLKAVAGVLRNRALLAGSSVADEALKPNQFEPWNPGGNNDPRRFKVDSPEYQAAKETILPVLRGDAPDPTGGATHFYAPKAQAALGRSAPQWDDGSGTDIGDHRFFRLPYAGRDPSALAQAGGGSAQPPGGSDRQAVGPTSLTGYVPAPGGGADNPDPSNPQVGFSAPAPAAPSPRPPIMPPGASGLNPGRPVPVAENEQDVQRLEGRMSMYPSGAYGATPELQNPVAPSSPRPAAVVGGNRPTAGAPTSPARSLADASAADKPSPDAQPAEFRIPPGPTRPEALPDTGNNRQSAALTHYGYWSAQLARSGSNKSLAEYAKAQMDISKEYLKPDQIERKLDAAGIVGQERKDIIRRSFSDSRPAEVQRYEYGQANPGFAEYEARLKDPSSKISADIEARKAGAEALGLKPGSAAYQSYTLTGKMPREDQQPLSATDKKAIMEADEGVLSGQTVIDNLRQAKDLSKKAYAGPLASARGYGLSFLGSESAQATVDLDNLVTTNALGQLKSIFGGNPTEGERKILLDIQGSSNLPDAARQKIYDRAIALAEKRLEFNRQRAADLRGQTYYKPDGGSGGSRGVAPSAAPPAFAVPDLEAEARRRGLIQ